MVTKNEIPIDINNIQEGQGPLEEYIVPILLQIWSHIHPIYLTIRQDILVGWNDRECFLLLIIVLIVLYKLLSDLKASLKSIYRRYITNRKSKIPQKDLVTIEKLRLQEAKRI